MLWLVVAIATLGAGSHWGRKRVEKEAPSPLGGSRRPCPKPKGPASQAPRGRCSRAGVLGGRRRWPHSRPRPMASMLIHPPATDLHGALLGGGPGAACGEASSPG